MNGKTKLDHVAACGCVAVAVFAACLLAFSQTAPASSAENQKACEPMPAAWEKLTPPQKSPLERMYNDWAYLPKYQEIAGISAADCYAASCMYFFQRSAPVPAVRLLRSR